MKYISDKKFFEQPKDIQKVFTDHWMPSAGDLIFNFKYKMLNVINEDYVKDDLHKKLLLDFAIPLLTAGQLIQFIEDMTGHKISISPSLEGNYYIGYDKYANNEDGDLRRLVYVESILEGLWLVALKVANNILKGCVHNE